MELLSSSFSFYVVSKQSVPIQIELSVERRRYTADTHRYFVDPSVCLCKATANPKKLPLVFPSLITGNRESILNPLQVRVTQNTAKAPWRYRLGAMFIPCAQISLPAAARSTPDWKKKFHSEVPVQAMVQNTHSIEKRLSPLVLWI
jgi:hypothetical protein